MDPRCGTCLQCRTTSARYDGDKGPNTGGMGTYTDADHKLPFLREQDIAEAQAINERVAAALAEECGAPYQGILYGGFMATTDGVKLIEYNARFGDPESLNLLTLLETDFVSICRAIVDRTLAETRLSSPRQASVCKYVVPEGYPDHPRKGDVVSLPLSLPPERYALPERCRCEGWATGCDGLTDSCGGWNGGYDCRGGVGVRAGRSADSGIVLPSCGYWHGTGDCSPRGTHEGGAFGMSLKVAVLGSTRGTALQGVLDAIAKGALDVEIVIVISDKLKAPILERAETYGVAALFLDPAGLKREVYDAQVTDILKSAGAELILMIGYMRIVSAGFVEAWKGRLLNVHPSLLPAFGGLMNQKVHEAVLAAGVTETGCTIHQVTEEVDGGPIVLQKRCAVLPDDTAETLKDRVQALEQTAFVEVLQGWRA